MTQTREETALRYSEILLTSLAGRLVMGKTEMEQITTFASGLAEMMHNQLEAPPTPDEQHIQWALAMVDQVRNMLGAGYGEGHQPPDLFRVVQARNTWFERYDRLLCGFELFKRDIGPIIGNDELTEKVARAIRDWRYEDRVWYETPTPETMEANDAFIKGPKRRVTQTDYDPPGADWIGCVPAMGSMFAEEIDRNNPDHYRHRELPDGKWYQGGAPQNG